MYTCSVIIPTYNCAKFIAEALNSVLSQTVQPIEIIVIDDGSTDETQQVVKSFNNPKIRYIKTENSGVSAARNLGMNLAIGDLISFLDADDRWRSKYLEHQIAAFEKQQGLALTITNFIRFSDEDNSFLSDQFLFYPELKAVKKTKILAPSTFLIDDDAFVSLIQFSEIPGYTQCTTLNRRIIADIRFDASLKICEDMDFMLRAASKGKACFNEEILVEVRRHPNNTTRDLTSISNSKLESLISLKNKIDLTEYQLKFYNRRLIKAHIDAALANMKGGNFHTAVTTFARCLKIKNGKIQKAKGFCRLIIESLRQLFSKRAQR